MPENVTCCENCSEEIDENEAQNDLCETCFSERYICCEKCYESVEIDDAKETSSGWVCESCFDEYCIECESCNSIERRDHAYYSNLTDSHYCDSCYSDNFTTCDSCDSEIEREDAHYTDNGCYCEDCEDENEDLYEFSGADSLPGTGRRIGVEIEVHTQDADDHKEIDRADKWTAVEDGTSGVCIEYNSPIMHKSNYSKELRDFCRGYLSTATVDSSCGVHVHIDCSDISWSELALIMRYCKQYEDFFFSLMPERRRKNHFCCRLPEMPKIMRKADLVRFLYGRENASKNSVKNKYPSPRENGCVNRYFWCNVHSYFFKRTVEFRLHSGSTNGDKLSRWCELLLAVFEHARKGQKNWQHPSTLVTQETKEYLFSRIEQYM